MPASYQQPCRAVNLHLRPHPVAGVFGHCPGARPAGPLCAHTLAQRLAPPWWPDAQSGRDARAPRPHGFGGKCRVAPSQRRRIFQTQKRRIEVECAPSHTRRSGAGCFLTDGVAAERRSVPGSRPACSLRLSPSSCPRGLRTLARAGRTRQLGFVPFHAGLLGLASSRCPSA